MGDEVAARPCKGQALLLGFVIRMVTEQRLRCFCWVSFLSESVVLGGTSQSTYGDGEPDAADRQAILNNVCAHLPSLRGCASRPRAFVPNRDPLCVTQAVCQ